MRTVPPGEAKAAIEPTAEAAEKGIPTCITKHGRAVAMVVPIKGSRRIRPDGRSCFADLLPGYPGGVDLERNRTPLREMVL
jgi:prevent-host-death family protein